VPGRFCCYAGGWSCRNTSAGYWYGCDVYGDGGQERVYYYAGSSGTFYMAVDSYRSVPQGGWYTFVMGSSLYTK
jgi:hypothetical protein